MSVLLFVSLHTLRNIYECFCSFCNIKCQLCTCMYIVTHLFNIQNVVGTLVNGDADIEYSFQQPLYTRHITLRSDMQISCSKFELRGCETERAYSLVNTIYIYSLALVAVSTIVIVIFISSNIIVVVVIIGTVVAAASHIDITSSSSIVNSIFSFKLPNVIVSWQHTHSILLHVFCFS